MADILIIRADGNSEIGSGHIVRCSAIAAEAAASGFEVLFAATDETSRNLVKSRGFRCEVIGGDYQKLGAQDADKLADLADGLDARAVLVDSYAASNAFFARLADRGVACAYIDDAYTFAGGFCAKPARRDVATVINYGFGFELSDYQAAYCDTSTVLHIGPMYAPVRDGFRDVLYVVRREVDNVLVTSGMTNPDRVLERMATGCRAALPDAHITVIVGGSATFDVTCLDGADFETIHDAQDMPTLMARADLAVSAAGTTLYELACVGLPMVAVPIVENQIGNARGVSKLGLGKSLPGIDWTTEDIRRAVLQLASSYTMRCALSAKERSVLDGRGAHRILDAVKSI